MTMTSPKIYCSQRFYNYPASNNRYVIPVPYNHTYYIVRLHFVELVLSTTNARRMNVYIEDQLIIPDLDVVAVSGGIYHAHVITVRQPFYIMDGTLTITMNSTKSAAMISGIEVIAAQPPLLIHRINCGATSRIPVIMNGNETWVRDIYATSGALSNRCGTTITNSIYCSSRYFRTSIGTPLRYNIPVPYNNAPYLLRLHFNELYYNTIGARVFDVWAENILILDHFDIIRDAPGKNVSMIVSISTPLFITDNVLTIDFVEISGDPQINGIEVIYIGLPIIPVSLPTTPVSSPPAAPVFVPPTAPVFVPLPTISTPVKVPTTPVTVPVVPTKLPTRLPTKVPVKVPITTTRPTKAPTKRPTSVPIKSPTMAPISVPVLAPLQPPTIIIGTLIHRINCGSTKEVIVPPNNIVWTSDQYATNGLSYNTCGNNITATTGGIYCTSRYFRAADSTPYRYNLPVPVSNRSYHVRLHFAEQYHKKANSRIFDVFVEGALVVDNLDMYAITGGNTSYVVTVLTFVTDGNIAIDLVRVKDNPQINGIEVFEDGAPIPPPIRVPQVQPTSVPLAVSPILVPVQQPVPAPVAVAPISVPVVQLNTTFQDIVINCGGPLYLEQSGLRYWSADKFFTDGNTYSITNIQVANTVDDPIYQSERIGTFSYSIPVPVGTYEINVHLAELAFTTAKTRTFNLTIESQKFDLVDIFALAGGTARAVSLGATVIVDDGFASISVAKVFNDPKINGIEIKKSVNHIAHSVSNGPYFAVDTSNVGFATVNVDGSESHTHGAGLVLTQWTWKEGAKTLSTGELSSFNMSVGTHDITLTVVDNGNYQSTEATTATVHPSGFPDIATLTPSSGSTIGGERVTIRGTGFNYPATDTIVFFGIDQLTGSAIQVINSTTITVPSPKIPISIPVLVSVQTPFGRSKESTFTYVSSTPISFVPSKLLNFEQPTCAEFGPDGKLYVGSFTGTLAKITLNENFALAVSAVYAKVQPGRAILGITFDPLDAGNPIPYVYISSSLLFHNESKSSSGNAINAKISRISGANLDVIEDIITGLPVCDNDHAVNQIQYGNKGELYVNIGSNTNGGVPGILSGSGAQKENYFSASTIVANISHPLFDGFIEYDALDDGSPINFNGISVFAPGLRNPFGITLHSNGNLYATDNGPNTGYGKMKVGCSPSDLLADQQREDKLVHLIKNRYYGHPNPKRAARDNDPRQCVWRNPTEPTSANYQAPIGVILSAATGIIEYQADHFNGQLRGNLIHVKYKKELLRTVLSVDGLSANPLTIPGLKLVGRNGLDVTQAPNGNLVEVQFLANMISVNVPAESVTASIRVSSVFPTRGSVAGGTILRIYGLNFDASATVTVGGRSCPIVGSTTKTYLQCTLPGHPEGLYDVVVTAVSGTYIFTKGYRYITGFSL